MSNKILHFVRREDADKYLAFRVCEWFDVCANTPRYGIQAQVMKGKWCHIAFQGAPLIFRDKVDARDEAKRLAALSSPSKDKQIEAV